MYHRSDGKKKWFNISEQKFTPEYAWNKKINLGKLIRKYIWRMLEEQFLELISQRGESHLFFVTLVIHTELTVWKKQETRGFCYYYL